MQIEVGVKSMCTKFGGHGLPGFGDLPPFVCLQISLLDHGHLQFGVNEGQKIKWAQKIHASRDCCGMHANQFW